MCWMLNMIYFQAQDLVFNENVLLQTLGFDVAIDHPHTYILQTCYLVKGADEYKIHTFYRQQTHFTLTILNETQKQLQYSHLAYALF